MVAIEGGAAPAAQLWNVEANHFDGVGFLINQIDSLLDLSKAALSNINNILEFFSKAPSVQQTLQRRFLRNLTYLVHLRIDWRIRFDLLRLLARLVVISYQGAFRSVLLQLWLSVILLIIFGFNQIKRRWVQLAVIWLLDFTSHFVFVLEVSQIRVALVHGRILKILLINWIPRVPRIRPLGRADRGARPSWGAGIIDCNLNVFVTVVEIIAPLRWAASPKLIKFTLPITLLLLALYLQLFYLLFIVMIIHYILSKCREVFLLQGCFKGNFKSVLPCGLVIDNLDFLRVINDLFRDALLVGLLRWRREAF